MFVIRREQLRRMAEDLDRRFFAELADWMKHSYFDQCAGKSDDELRNHVRAVAERAVGYGIRGVDEVREFLELECLQGPIFESKFAGATSVLQDSALSGPAKLSLLKERMEAAR